MLINEVLSIAQGKFFVTFEKAQLAIGSLQQNLIDSQGDRQTPLRYNHPMIACLIHSITVYG